MEKRFKIETEVTPNGIPLHELDIIYKDGIPIGAEMPGKMVEIDHGNHRKEKTSSYLSKKFYPNFPDDCKNFYLNITYCMKCKIPIKISFAVVVKHGDKIKDYNKIIKQDYPDFHKYTKKMQDRIKTKVMRRMNKPKIDDYGIYDIKVIA